MSYIEIEDFEETLYEAFEKPVDLEKRTHSHIPSPASHKIPSELLISQKCSFIDHEIVKIHFLNEGRLTEEQAKQILEDSNGILKKEPNLLKIDKPITIIGDIHGQYYDLYKLLSKINLNKDVVLFLGDYVDRGYFSIEVYLYLLLLKTHYPKNLYLLRGNHESKQMTKYFTFKEECSHKYSKNLYDLFVKSFNKLPLAAVVMGKLFCVHGGISPSLKTLEDINLIDRFREPDYSGLFCDLLWSDPHPNYDADLEENEYVVNKTRRCSFYYTYKGVCSFLDKHNLISIIRGHEVQNEGYRVYKKYKQDTPSIITVFSAPNYCDAYKNKGAVLKFDGDNIKLQTYKEEPHPYSLPNFLDGINWSFPFISEKSSEFLLDLLKFLRQKELSLSSESSEVKKEDLLEQEIEKTEEFTSSMAIMREERECLNELEDAESEIISSVNIKYPNTEEEVFYDAKDRDEKNEIQICDEMIIDSLSIKASPSCTPPLTKKLQDCDLESVIEGSRIVVLDKNAQAIKLMEKKKKGTLFKWCMLE